MAKVLNCATTPVDKAYKYTQEQCDAEGKMLSDYFSDFYENYLMLQEKCDLALDLPRIEMPVIEPEQMDEFEESLDRGHIDVNEPIATSPETGKKDKYPTDLGFDLRGRAWLFKGLRDGARSDDIVQADMTEIAVADLKPTQSQIWLEKVVGMSLYFGPLKQSSKFLHEAPIIVSSDGYILDGHHRFGAAMVSNPSLRLTALKVDMPIDELVKMARSYGNAIGNEQKAAETFEEFVSGFPQYNEGNLICQFCNADIETETAEIKCNSCGNTILEVDIDVRNYEAETYNVPKPEVDKVVDVDCVNIVSKKSAFTGKDRNFYRVSFRDAGQYDRFGIPAWAARAAETMGTKYYGVSGCKMVMGMLPSGKWQIQAILIPNTQKMNKQKALKIANHMQDRIEKEGQWARKKCRENEIIEIYQAEEYGAETFEAKGYSPDKPYYATHHEDAPSTVMHPLHCGHYKMVMDGSGKWYMAGFYDNIEEMFTDIFIWHMDSQFEGMTNDEFLSTDVGQETKREYQAIKNIGDARKFAKKHYGFKIDFAPCFKKQKDYDAKALNALPITVEPIYDAESYGAETSNFVNPRELVDEEKGEYGIMYLRGGPDGRLAKFLHLDCPLNQNLEDIGTSPYFADEGEIHFYEPDSPIGECYTCGKNVKLSDEDFDFMTSWYEDYDAESYEAERIQYNYVVHRHPKGSSKGGWFKSKKAETFYDAETFSTKPAYGLFGLSFITGLFVNFARKR